MRPTTWKPGQPWPGPEPAPPTQHEGARLRSAYLFLVDGALGSGSSVSFDAGDGRTGSASLAAWMAGDVSAWTFYAAPSTQPPAPRRQRQPKPGRAPVITPRVAADPDLGRMSDREFAARHGCSPTTVRAVRAAAGIPAYDPNASERFVDKVISDPDLGQVPDYVIAARYECTRDCVREIRERFGIVPPRQHVARAMRHPDLGEVPDRHLAREMKISASSVREARRQLGIARPSPERTAILGAVLEGYRKAKAIIRATRVKEGTARQILSALVEEGVLIHTGHGTYEPAPPMTA